MTKRNAINAAIRTRTVTVRRISIQTAQRLIAAGFIIILK